jgi:sulfatase maturation enzyme AslB (radical SAM superfamily)
MHIDDIRSLHIELTTKCNARCPMCVRNVKGYPYNAGYPETEISLADYKKILPVTFLSQIKNVNFNGGYGDFGIAQDAKEILRYTSMHVNDIIISTNASMRDEKWWSSLAETNVKIQFAIDGLEDTHSIYRIQTNYDKIIRNAMAFIDAGGHAIWKMIKFKHNEHQIDEAHQLSKVLGFKDFELIDHGRDQSAVFNRNGDFAYWIGETNHDNTPISIFEESFNAKNNIKRNVETPVIATEIKSFIEAKVYADSTATINCVVHKQHNQIYIAADCSIYPCCFTGNYPHTMQHPGNKQLKQIVKENNALIYSISHCIEWFDELYKSWDSPIKQDICILSCSDCSQYTSA